MKIPCPNCKGTGIAEYVKWIALYVSTTEESICQECKGTGLVEAGYKAKKMRKK